MHEYLKVMQDVPNPVGQAAAIAHLNKVLPPLWADAYPASGGELLTVTTGGKMGEKGVVSTMFNLHASKTSKTEDRVVAVWASRRRSQPTRETPPEWRFPEQGVVGHVSGT